MTRIKQNAFSAGIMSEGMYARTDTDKYQKGVRDALNVNIRPQGGLFNRSGNQIVGPFDVVAGLSDAKPWLIPFNFNTEQTYQLEFAEDFFRVIKNGGYVLDGAFTPLEITSISTGNPCTFTTASPLTFSADQLYYLEDPAGTHKLHQTIIRVTGYDGANYTFRVYDNETLDASVGDWGVGAAGATIRRVYQATHGYALADMPKVRFAQDADVIYLAHRAYPPRKISRFAEDSWTCTDVTFQTGIPGLVTGLTITPGPSSGARVTRYQVSPVNEDDEEGLPCAVATGTNDLSVTANKNLIQWSAFPGAVRYRVYKRDGPKEWGLMATTDQLTMEDSGVIPNVSRVQMTERNPFPTPGKYPGVVAFYEQRIVWGSTSQDPQLVEMSRVASIESFTTTYPLLADDAVRFRLRAQQLNRIHAFIPGDVFGILTSAGEWELDAQGDGTYIRPERRRLAPHTYFGCANFEPLLLGAVALFLEPSLNTIRDYRLGDRSNPPGDLTLLCRDLFRDRAIVSWAFAKAPDQTVWVVFADGGVASLTYIPDQEVWGWTRHQFGGTDVFVSQVSVSREGNTDTPYFVVSRTINGKTTTWVERQRPREDTDVKRCYYLDGGLFGDYGTQVSQVSGYLHLRGQTVTALVDGDVFKNLVVDNTGTVVLGGRDGQIVSVGLPYTALVQTLDVEAETKEFGSTMGRFKGVSEAAIRIERTRGIEVGQSLSRMNFLKEWEPSMIGEPIPLRSEVALFGIEGDWVKDMTLYVRQTNPLPMTINGIGPEYEFRD